MNNPFWRLLFVLVIVAMLALIYMSFVIGTFRLYMDILNGLI